MIKLLIRTAYFLVTLTSLLHAQVPQLISYQGRVGVDGVNFDGSGQFKFAFVNAAGTETYWSNDGSSTAGSEPGAAITLPVSKGLYSILLGDATLPHMSIVSATVFTHGDVHLRVWFSDGVNGFQQLAPDRRIAAVGYAMMADSVSDGAITTAKIADGAVTSEKLAADVMQTTNAATSANNPGTIIKRDANGDFSAGTITASAFLGKGVVPWLVVSVTSQQAESNTGYVADNADEVTVTLPSSPGIGDLVRVTGAGSGGWRIAQNAGQLIASSLVVEPGTSWLTRESLRNWTCVASSADGSKLVAGVYNGQIYTSSDSGATWTPRATNQAWKSVASSVDGTKLVAVVSNGQIHTSNDSGFTWVSRDSVRNWSCVASSADGTKLVAAVQGDKIYKSIDSGATWSVAYFFEAQWNAISSSSSGDRLLASSGANLFISSDSGSSWSIPSGGDVRNGNGSGWWSVNMSSDGVTMIASSQSGLDAGIYVSKDGGAYWTARYRPISTYVACSADGSMIVVAGFVSRDSGQSWSQRDMPGSRFALSADGSKVVSVGSQIYTSSSDTTAGSTGYLRGQSSSSIELQYIGNGRFLPLGCLGTLYPY